jgi:hypothetical protein
VTGNTFQCFYSAATHFVELNRQDFCPVCKFLSAQSALWLPSVTFSLKEYK